MALSINDISAVTKQEIVPELVDVPESDEPNKPLAILKTVGMTAVLIGAGVATYAWGKHRQRRNNLNVISTL